MCIIRVYGVIVVSFLNCFSTMLRSFSQSIFCVSFQACFNPAWRKINQLYSKA